MCNGLRNSFGLIRVRGLLGSVVYGTKGAVAAALITKDHKGGCVVSKTFQLVGAVGLLTDGAEVEIHEQIVDFAYRGFEAEPPP